jgi:Zn-dependent peptidase ImmA (M78 family)
VEVEKVRANLIAAKAIQTRKKYLNLAPYHPVCPYVLSEAMGFDLRFVNIPSFEGMYISEEHLILISAERPEGRKRFTCAHEIGHHVLGHGTVIDEIIKSGSDKEKEVEADFFAGILLMPSSSVSSAIRRYGKQYHTLDQQDAYILSKYFGVSYKAFITQLHYNLKLIDNATYQNLAKRKPQDIRKTIYDVDTNGQIIVIGDWWQEKAIDLEVNDHIIAHNNIHIDGPLILETIKVDGKNILKALSPGITRIYTDSGWSCFVKISRKKFNGLFQFKYEEDEE